MQAANQSGAYHVVEAGLERWEACGLMADSKFRDHRGNRNFGIATFSSGIESDEVTSHGL
jgi:hypothetical protein